MITIIDIYKAIKDAVLSNLTDTQYSTIEFSSTDITEKIIRPCFYLNYDNNRTKKANASNKDRNLDVELFFFAENRDDCRLDLMTMEGLLEDILLKDIKVLDNFYIPISDFNFKSNKDKGYLIATFELHTIEMIQDTVETETLEILNIKEDDA